ncbi:MAG TPA: CoA transferase [Candidatus Dormibacteraeota bacterium]|nr:CoA transferase [Candidatus Dormibacteraeota bacterium]
MSDQPLAGVRVLEPAVLLAAPFSSSLMADFGAEVIKLEMPRSGDPMRQLPPMKDGKSLWWKATARNKKSATLDLRTEKGQELFKRLAAVSDVVIENFRPGVMEKWGLGWDTLHAINPRLIMVRQTGFGQFGPYSHRPAYGMIVESYAGLPDALGYSDTPPVMSGLGDNLAGLVIVYAIMFALYHRDVHGGPGQLIDNAASEGMLRVVGEHRVPAVGLGVPLMQKRASNGPHMGIGQDALRVAGMFHTKDDKWCVFHSGTAGTSIWANLCRAMGREDFLDEAPYPVGSPERKQRLAEIDRLVTEWFEAHTRDEVVQIATDHEITIAPVYSMEDAMNDPHFRARGAFITVDDPDFGPFQMVNVTPRLSETPGEIRHTGPSVGAHTEEVYGTLLGMSSAEIDALRAEGVI